MSFADFTAKIVTLVDSAVIPLIYALAFIGFLIGMVRFLFMGGEEGRKKGKEFMLWSIIAFVVMFGVWGFVRIFLAILQ